MIVALVAVALVAVALFDGIANNGKAFGNVFVNGQSVAGMTADQIRSELEEGYAQKISSSEVRIYASEEAREREASDLARRETAAQAEQVSVDEATAKATSWTTSASQLRATVPYDDVIAQALEAGRQGGPLARLALFFVPANIDFSISFDDDAVEDLASRIDATVGEKRSDATVQIDDGVATAVKGVDGKMVDRGWLKQKLAEALFDQQGESSFVAKVTDAPSRTTYEQAQQMSSNINRALNCGLSFTYGEQFWTPDARDIGSWTRVKVAEVEGGFDLKVGVDTSSATSDLVKHLDASVSSNNVIVDFEKADDGIVVKTSGSGIIPEVGPAVEQIGQVLYGSTGIAWGGSAVDPRIQVQESNAPEQLTFDQALDLGIITVIGEYTTEFSNAEGTENRNHNIKLAADLLNDTITDSNGGTWSFNGHSGDTNLDPPFASAGSIVDGEYVDSIGGGICQVATTVFNAVYEAGLDINERRNHSLYIASYPTGRDAAVSYPEMDFVWSNPLPSDTLLRLSYTDTTVTAKLYGTPTGYKVTTETGEWEEGEKYKTDYEVDEDMEEGSYYLKTTGSDGSQIAITRTVTDLNGQIVKQDSFTSIYTPKNEVYLIGPGTDTSRLSRDTSYDPDDPDDSDNPRDPDDPEGEYDGYDFEPQSYDEELGEGFYEESEYDQEGDYGYGDESGSYDEDEYEL